MCTTPVRHRGWARVAHADEVGHDAATKPGDVRHDVAPQVRRRRVAVQEDDRRTGPDVDVGHVDAVDVDVLFGERKLGTHRHGVS